MSAIRVCYFDVDNTLIGPDLTIHPELASALAACREQGIRLGLATGRILRSAAPYAKAVGVDVPLILYNGAMIQDFATGQVFFERTVPLDEARQAILLASRLGLHVNLYVGDEIYVERESEESLASAAKDGVRQHVVGPLCDFLKEPPRKLLLIGPGEVLEEFRRLFDASFHASSLARSEVNYLEVLPEGVSKGAALALVSTLLDIPLSAIAAFGDSPNDREMLELAGLGVAVGNALPSVKATARHVTTKNYGEGVAEGLWRFVLGLDEAR